MKRCWGLLVVLPGLALLGGADWPGFRGADGSGVAAGAKVPTTWGDSQNLRWKFELPGPGASSPIVWKDRVYVTCYSGYGDGGKGEMKALRRHLVCVDRAKGTQIWQATVPSAVEREDPYSGYISEHGYASSTPVTDGERIYCFFGKSGVVAFDLEGRQLWQTSVGTASGNRRWGSAGGIVLFEDLVIVNASEESRSIRGLNARTGVEVWSQQANKLELCYSTPVVAKLADGTAEMVVAVPGEVWGVNPRTGKLRWFASTPYTGNSSPSPVLKGDVAFVFGGYPQTGTAAVRVGGSGDVTKANVLWTSKTSSYVPSPVVHGEHLYWVNDRGLACCARADTGEVVYQERLPVRGGSGGSRPVYASVVLAGDQLVAVSRSAGAFTYPVGPKFTEPKVSAFTDSSDFNASPAVAGDELYLRSNRFLYCVASR